MLFHYLLLSLTILISINSADVCDDHWVQAQQNQQQTDQSAEPQPLSVAPAVPISPIAYHNELHQYWMESYKTMILRELNLQTEPEPGTRRIPKSIRSQFESIKEREGEPLSRLDNCTPTPPTKNDVVRSAVLETPPAQNNAERSTSWKAIAGQAKTIKKVIISSINKPNGEFAIDPMRSYFQLTNIKAADVVNATLYVFTQRHTSQRNEIDELRMHIYKYANDLQIVADPVFSQSYKHNIGFDQWLSVNVTELVHIWAKSPAKNYGLMVKAERTNGGDLVNRTLDDFNRTTNIILALEFDETSPTRNVREQNDEITCSTDFPEEKCCRYPLTLDFQAFGWDWVIAPKRYNAYYCAGSCPINYKQRTPHAHLTQQLSSTSTIKHAKSGLGPCCVPNEYEPLKIVYITETGAISERRVSGAIVSRCGCA